MPWTSSRRAFPAYPWRKWKSRHSCTDPNEVLDRIWGLSTECQVWNTAPYLQFYEQLFSDLGTSIVFFPDRKCVLQVLDALREARHLPISEIKSRLEALNTSWTLSDRPDEGLNLAIELLIQLWLMVKPMPEHCADASSTISQIVSRSLAVSSPKHLEIVPSLLCPNSIKAKNLERIAGLEIISTSSLNEHLLLDGNRLKVFAHSSMLKQYLNSAAERELYPDGILEETRRTLQLLYPTWYPKDARRTRRSRNRRNVDIEAADISELSRSLSAYQHWGPRLAIIQQYYENARPRKYKQWWFDRRNRVEWATLLVAVIIFFMTLVFGVIATVTSILQVYAAFRRTI